MDLCKDDRAILIVGRFAGIGVVANGCDGKEGKVALFAVPRAPGLCFYSLTRLAVLRVLVDEVERDGAARLACEDVLFAFGAEPLYWLSAAGEAVRIHDGVLMGRGSLSEEEVAGVRGYVFRGEILAGREPFALETAGSEIEYTQ